MSRRRPLWRDIAAAAVTSLARFGDKTATAWANVTADRDPICRVCHTTTCTHVPKENDR